MAVFLLRSRLPPLSVSFAASSHEIDSYDFVEIVARVSPPHAANPFTGAAIRATFQSTSRNDRWQIDGFCDAEDGSVYRVRFMPPAAGDYTYSVEYRQGWSTKASTGTFRV